jgi:uncharacterized membrane protein
MNHDEGKAKTVLRWLLTVFMTAAGVNHFLAPAQYAAMIPGIFPAHLALVHVSGVAEVLGGLGLILPSTRRLAAWGLVALFVAVFPANINMAVHHLPLGGRPVPTWALWLRLPLQVVLVAWAWWYTRSAPRAVAERPVLRRAEASPDPR